MEIEEVELRSNQEFRIEVPEGKKLRIMVVAGIAEVRGQELLVDRWYVFSKIATAVFTFSGARLRVDGPPCLRYVAHSSMVPSIFGYFSRLYGDGSDAAEFRTKTRRVMVVGKGRETLCTILANYFVRMHEKVLFTEVDPARGCIFPGALSSTVVDSIQMYSEGFKLNNPYCLFYGRTEIENVDLYDAQLDALVSVAKERQPYFQIILAPSFEAGPMNNVIKRMEVDEVVFVGDERLYNRLDVVVRKVYIENTGYFKFQDNLAVGFNRYFNGVENEYTPCSLALKGNWKIVRVGEEHAAPDSALPLGGTRKVDRLSVNPTEMNENSVLAISEAQNESEIALGPVAGFVVCLDKERQKILCVQPKLPKLNYLIQGSLQFVDY